MRIKNITEEIELPEKVTAQAEENTIIVKGPKGELKRTFKFPFVQMKTEGNTITISANDATKKEKTHVGTAYAHINNMIRGVTKGHTYKLKVCSGHFPMTVAVSGDTLTVKNFLGEKIPRTLKLKTGAAVKVEGNDITIESIDIEIAGQVAADIEQLTRITNRDIRIFQDGIYITKKSKDEA